MIFKRPLTALAVTVAAFGLSLGFVSASQAAAKKPSKTTKKSTKKTTTKVTTVTACVKNKTGATTVLLGSKAKKKCPKGSTKVTWNVAGKNGTDGKNGANGVNGLPGANGANGANGLTGPTASPFSLIDANGKNLGAYAGTIGLGLPIYQVLVDGGLYFYLPTGQLYPLSPLGGLLGGLLGGGGVGGPTGTTSPGFRNAACTGTAYLPGPAPELATLYAQFLGGPSRIVFRTIPAVDPDADPSDTGGIPFDFDDLGPARAWKATSDSVSVTDADVWTLNPATGGCESATTDFTGTLLALAEVPAPPDGVGPLTIG